MARRIFARLRGQQVDKITTRDELHHSLDATNRLIESREWLADPHASIGTSWVTVMLDEVSRGLCRFQQVTGGLTRCSRERPPRVRCIRAHPIDNARRDVDHDPERQASELGGSGDR